MCAKSEDCWIIIKKDLVSIDEVHDNMITITDLKFNQLLITLDIIFILLEEIVVYESSTKDNQPVL